MVSRDSDLYRAHPDWAIQLPGHPHSEGRNQRILDLTRKEVQDYIIKAMTGVFSSARIEYVKWDMNRTFTDVYSSALPPEQQGEVFHRYVLGLYRIIKELTERFPEILFEGCSAGGNRSDLGILCYFPQIWASDNTDSLCRTEIQQGYSYGYPLSCFSAHVSASPNHQTLRQTSLWSRFNVAAFGLLGYELNLADLSSEEFKSVASQVSFYKEWRDVFFGGTFLPPPGRPVSCRLIQDSWNSMCRNRGNTFSQPFQLHSVDCCFSRQEESCPHGVPEAGCSEQSISEGVPKRPGSPQNIYLQKP